MGIARRQFLQAGLASLMGWQFLSRDRLAFAAEQYAHQASVSTQRKRALLIGINQYDAKEEVQTNPQNFSQNFSQGFNQNAVTNGWLPLHGCVNDVELQKELLIYRFGFAPQDILTLTDREATRSNIAEAITSHLTAQTLPDDLVLVHFSGHGSRLGNYNTLVPVDSGLPQNLDTLRDIPLQEWQTWLNAIATDRILSVIDAGFYYPNTSAIGNFRLRSRIGRSDWQPNDLETMEPQVKGATLRAATGDMLCADAQWSGFSSGAFTYALVQQLWQITPPKSIQVVMSDLATTLDRRALHNENLSINKQISEMVEIDPAKQKAIATSTFAPLLPIPDFGCDGVITNSTGDRRTAHICLAGLPISVLSNYANGSILNVIAASIPKNLEEVGFLESSIQSSIQSSNSTSQNISAVSIPKANVQSLNVVQLKSRNGFNGKVEVLGDRVLQRLEIGQLLQEAMRAISHNVKLAIALDVGLSKIERVDATSAFSTLPNMFGVNANEQCADCLFGVQSASYGLFTVGHTPILGSFGSVGESVGVAIKRLQPFLESLLAAKLIRCTENQASSLLDVRTTFRAMIGVDGRSVTIASKASARGVQVPNSNLSNSIRTKPINIGDRLECQIENFSNQPLYIRIFCLDPRSKILTPNFIATPYANDGVIPPSETLTIPYPKSPMNWSVSAPKGMVDVHVVISTSPLLQVAKILEASQRQTSSLNGLIAIPNALQVAQALLMDLDRAGKPSDFMNTNNANEAWMLDVRQWATFNFSYEVA
ncbi:caspase family protein [Pseudanabaena sp. FACHB-1998]|uniref:caspase family protein n=1 Tax=Pseudanabaena sp. FACHB-1998 TaxID=2692858 RepID=UPI0016801828|nr:caspase family protein [Pseudanabaena sp. FACHB-1998]